jgi:hypothetical protein
MCDQLQLERRNCHTTAAECHTVSERQGRDIPGDAPARAAGRPFPAFITLSSHGVLKGAEILNLKAGPNGPMSG